MTRENRQREIRRERGLALRGLTASSGVSTATLSAVEKWGYHPTEPTKARIAAALGVRSEEIWPAAAEAAR
jgi:lambda repressor-like predicted transcriptional regulator